MPATTPKPKPFPDLENGSKKENDNGYKRPTFVRCDLSSDQKNEMAEWANSRTADDLLDLISESTDEGYVLSLKPGEKGFQASLTQSQPIAVHVRNGGKCLVTRASKPERALWSLYYKHTQVMVKDWSKGNEEYELEW